MKNKKMYFENEDASICYSLEHHLENAKADGLKQITLFEAIPCTDETMVWCTELEEVVERESCDCSCPYYKENTESGACKLKGKLMDWGDEVTFDVETGNVI